MPHEMSWEDQDQMRAKEPEKWFALTAIENLHVMQEKANEGLATSNDDGLDIIIAKFESAMGELAAELQEWLTAKNTPPEPVEDEETAE